MSACANMETHTASGGRGRRSENCLGTSSGISGGLDEAMSTLRKKFAGFIRQLSNPGLSLDDADDLGPKSPTSGSFIQRYLNGEVQRTHPEILCSKSFQDLPVRMVGPLERPVFAAFTGPQGGLTTVNRNPRTSDSYFNGVDFINEDTGWRQARLAQPEDLEEFMETITPSKTSAPPSRRPSNAGSRKTSIEEDYNLVTEKNYQYFYEENCGNSHGDAYYFKDTENIPIAGLKNWNRPHERAFGAATTLYERHPITQEKAGEPIADAFAVCARENNAILVLADGVNWGEKSCLAARCAVHGCVDYLNKVFFGDNNTPVETTSDIFAALLRSMFAAHNLILQEEGLLTTLCTAFVCPLRDSDKFIMCTCNVGDSLAYVYSQKYGVREVTQGSHDIHSMRDMRDALGALGPVDGNDPELGNLTCSMTIIEVGDIVFITSDGISDNFDPVVGKFAMAREPQKQDEPPTPVRKKSTHGIVEEPSNGTVSLPFVEAYQRHELTLLRMEDLLRHGVTVGDTPCHSAQELCEKLVDFSYKLTVAKRRILEDPELYSEENGFTRAEQRSRRRRLCEKLAMVPGKLDHASVVAYQVGYWNPPEFDEPDSLSPELTQLANHIASVFRPDAQIVKESFV